MKWIKISSVLFLSLVALTIFNKVRFKYDWNNAIWRTVMTPMTATTWTKDFSEKAFASVKPGMNVLEVGEKLGEPMYKGCTENGCTFSYSKGDTDAASYDRRWVSFDRADFVSAIRHEFYID